MIIEGLALTILLICLGICIGIVSGFFGIGGAFILTPLLTMLGMPATNAVATSLTFTVGVSLVGGYKHCQAGNYAFKVFIYVSIFSLVGVSLAKPVLLFLEQAGLAKDYIQFTFVFLLLLMAIATYMKNDEANINTDENNCEKKQNTSEAFNKIHLHSISSSGNISNIRTNSSSSGLESKSRWGSIFAEAIKLFNDSKIKIMRLLKNIPPMVMIAEGKKASFWIMVLIGIFVGFVKGFLGVGGGFLVVPLLIIWLNMEARLAVGTSMLVLLVSSVYGTGLYWFDGYVKLFIAAILICGASISIKYGVEVIKHFNDSLTKKIYARFLFLAGLGILLKQLGLESISIGYLIILIVLLAAFIFKNYLYIRAHKVSL